MTVIPIERNGSLLEEKKACLGRQASIFNPSTILQEKPLLHKKRLKPTISMMLTISLTSNMLYSFYLLLLKLCQLLFSEDLF